jgi:hypothetical protein
MSTEYAVRFQEMIAKMPETFTMKEVDEYCKNAKKDIKAKINEENKDKKAHRKKCDKKVDGVEPNATHVKVVKPPSKRKIFYDEMRSKIQAQFPGLNPEKTNEKLAELWKIHLDELFAFKPMGICK